MNIRLSLGSTINYFEKLYDNAELWFQENRSLLGQCIVITFIIGLATHAFIFFNPCFSHDSLNIYQSITWQYSLGRFVIPLFYKLQGGYSVSWLIGLLSLCWLSITVFLLCRIFQTHSLTFIFLSGSVLIINKGFLSFSATYIFELSPIAFSILTAVGAIYFSQKKSIINFLLSVFCITLTLGVYQSNVGVAIGLGIILSIVQCFQKNDIKNIIYSGLRLCFILLLGGILYYLLWKLLQIKYPMVSDGYWELNTIGDYSKISLGKVFITTYANYFVAFFKKTKFSPKLIVFCNIILFATAILTMFYYFIKSKLDHKYLHLFLAGVLCCILPFGLNFANFLSRFYCPERMQYAYLLVYLLIFIIFSFLPIKKCICALLCCCYGVICFNGIVDANTLYLKKYMEFNNTLSIGTRVLDRIENTDGFDPNRHTVYLEGFPENEYIANKKLFPGYYKFNGTEYTLSSTGFPARYYKYILPIKIKVRNLSRPASVIQDLEKKYPGIIAKINAMPEFPHKDCIKIFGDILIVRMSKKQYKKE